MEQNNFINIFYFKKFALGTMKGIIKEVGYEHKPSDNAQRKICRENVKLYSCLFGNEIFNETVIKKVEKWFDDPSNFE